MWLVVEIQQFSLFSDLFTYTEHSLHIQYESFGNSWTWTIALQIRVRREERALMELIPTVAVCKKQYRWDF